MFVFSRFFGILGGKDKWDHIGQWGDDLFWYRKPGAPQLMLLDRCRHQCSHSLIPLPKPAPVTHVADLTGNLKEPAPENSSMRATLILMPPSRSALAAHVNHPGSFEVTTPT